MLQTALSNSDSALPPRALLASLSAIPRPILRAAPVANVFLPLSSIALLYRYLARGTCAGANPREACAALRPVCGCRRTRRRPTAAGSGTRRCEYRMRAAADLMLRPTATAGETRKRQRSPDAFRAPKYSPSRGARRVSRGSINRTSTPCGQPRPPSSRGTPRSRPRACRGARSSRRA